MKSVLRRLYQLIVNILPPEDDSTLFCHAGAYWSESATSEIKKDLSHWRGIGRWDNERWFQIGERHFRMFEDLCKISGVSKGDVRTMIEWGQGGGANAVRFAKHVSVFFGVDISQPNLNECSSQLHNIAFEEFHPVLVKPESPGSCIDEIKHPADFFLSTAVFQHFPSKSYGIEVLKISRQLLKSEGIALIQIRYEDHDSRYAPKRRNYRRNAVTFTSYKIDEFWMMCKEIGYRPLYVNLDTTVNYAYYFLKRE